MRSSDRVPPLLWDNDLLVAEGEALPDCLCYYDICREGRAPNVCWGWGPRFRAFEERGHIKLASPI